MIENNKDMNKSETRSLVSFRINGMTCSSCADRIENVLYECQGVEDAGVDFDRREATVIFDPAEVSPDDLKKSVQAIGYHPQDDQIEGLEKRGDPGDRFNNLRAYLIGAAAALGVVGFYLGLLTLTSDWFNARLEFQEYGLWIIALALGLGVQATLFSLFRAWHRGGESMKAAKCNLAASGGMSTTAMAACCAHYLPLLLPALGLPFLSAAAASLAEYQTYFFMAGVISNLFGIGFMLRMMHRSGMIQLRPPMAHHPVRFQKVIK